MVSMGLLICHWRFWFCSCLVKKRDGGMNIFDLWPLDRFVSSIQPQSTDTKVVPQVIRWITLVTRSLEIPWNSGAHWACRDPPRSDFEYKQNISFRELHPPVIFPDFCGLCNSYISHLLHPRLLPFHSHTCPHRMVEWWVKLNYPRFESIW